MLHFFSFSASNSLKEFAISRLYHISWDSFEFSLQTVCACTRIGVMRDEKWSIMLGNFQYIWVRWQQIFEQEIHTWGTHIFIIIILSDFVITSNLLPTEWIVNTSKIFLEEKVIIKFYVCVNGNGRRNENFAAKRRRIKSILSSDRSLFGNFSLI